MDELATYRTVARSSAGEYREKGSKFLGFVYPARNEEETVKILEDLRSSHYDARHHCYAYVLGYQGEQYRANDDGEPGHSAGDPILGQLRSRGLTQVICVVVRYFGGTKLGVGGLINAYKTAASEALENAGIVEKEVTTGLTLEYPYESTSEIMRLVDEFSLTVLDQQFDLACSMKAEVNINRLSRLKEKVQLLHDTGTELRLEVI